MKRTISGLVFAVVAAACLVGAARKFSVEVRQRIMSVGVQCAEDGWRMAQDGRTLRQATNTVARELEGAFK